MSHESIGYLAGQSEGQEKFSGDGSFIQIKLIDGTHLYTEWWNENNPDQSEAARLADFSEYISEGIRARQHGPVRKSFIARKRFIKGAPEYECQVYPRNVVSLSVISAGWENILDDGQEPVYLYKDEIYALLNAARPNADYNPPALDSAIDALLDAINERDEEG